MHANGTHSNARPRPRPPRREFVTTICTEDLGRYAGVGLSLEQVIEEELRQVGAAPKLRVEESDDLVIWEGNKIAALIRTAADGRPVVTRFDRPGADPGPSESEAGKVPAGDALDAASVDLGLSPGGPTVSETRAAIAHVETLRWILLALDGDTGRVLTVVDLKNVCRLDPGRGGAPAEIP